MSAAAYICRACRAFRSAEEVVETVNLKNGCGATHLPTGELPQLLVPGDSLTGRRADQRGSRAMTAKLRWPSFAQHMGESGPLSPKRRNNGFPRLAGGPATNRKAPW